MISNNDTNLNLSFTTTRVTALTTALGLHVNTPYSFDVIKSIQRGTTQKKRTRQLRVQPFPSVSCTLAATVTRRRMVITMKLTSGEE